MLLYHSNNTNEQLANVLGQLTNTLTANQTSSLNANSRETKVYISNTFSSTKPDKLNNFLFNVIFTSILIPYNST